MRRLAVVVLPALGLALSACSSSPSPTTGTPATTGHASSSTGTHGSSGTSSTHSSSSSSTGTNESGSSSGSSGSTSTSSNSSSSSTTASSSSSSTTTSTGSSSSSSTTTSAGSNGTSSSSGSTGTTSSGSGTNGSSGSTIVECGAIPANPDGGTCSYTAGGAGLLLTGNVLGAGVVYHGGQVAVDATGVIACVGCDCSAAVSGATAISCPQGVISPALINTHDHIGYIQNPPYDPPTIADGGLERFEHRNDWRRGLNGHTEINTPSGATADQVRWGELRFLMGGATATVGAASDGQTGFLRDLNNTSLMEGLTGQKAVDFDTFPLGDSNGAQLATGCGYPGVVAQSSITGDDSYEPHIAEGIRDYATNEFNCLDALNVGHDVIQHNTAVIHAVGLTAAQYAEMAGNGTKLIWSPRSNITLYGDTARVTTAAQLGVTIALGTDWSATGSMNTLRELACIDNLNQNYFGHFFSDEQLWLMATYNAARATAVDDALGTLQVGKIADISIFNGATNTDYRAVLAAQAQDVVLVMRGGKILYGDDSLVADATCDAVNVCGVNKRVCVQSEIGKSYSALQTAGGTQYPTFFCGTPTKEPSCTPQRWTSLNNSTVYTAGPTAGDSDGDGIPDATDNCPTIFNPVRPMDNGVQPDSDGDGLGDACDPCPLDPTNSCGPVDPNDIDGDGVPNAQDNCPTLANPSQTDSDNDGHGDACDACPNSPNPGSQACPASIYDIKNGTIAQGSIVSLPSALVTARYPSGYVVQVAPTDPDYRGTSDYSGIFVFQSGNTAVVGQRMFISSGTVVSFPAGATLGEIELSNVTATPATTTTEALPPTTVVANPLDIATGGSRVAALEGVLVEVDNVSVTDVNPTPGTGEATPTNEYAVAGGLRIDDLFYLTTPFPAVGTHYDALIGPMMIRFNNSKIEPRNANDVEATLGLGAFSPALSFAQANQTSVSTYPTPLTVSLNHVTSTDTAISVTSTDTNHVILPSGTVTIPAGQLSAPVLVNTLTASQPVVLNAQFGSQAPLSASVRVLDGTETPTLVSLTSNVPAVSPSGSAVLTVTLDLPPATDTSVPLVLANPDGGTLSANPAVVLANTLTSSVTYTDTGGQPQTISGTLGATAQVSINVNRYQDLVFTEYVETSGNNKALEISNLTGGPIDLSGYKILEYANGSATANGTGVALSGSLANGASFVVCNNAATSTALQAVCNLKTTSVAMGFNGNDAITLVRISDGSIADSIGQIGTNPGTSWLANGVNTVGQDLQRKCDTLADSDPTNAYDPSVDFANVSPLGYANFGTYSCP